MYIYAQCNIVDIEIYIHIAQIKRCGGFAN